MTLQSQSKITCITRFILTAMLLILASASAAAQTNTFPPSGSAGVGTTTPWQKLTVLGTPGNREGVSIAGEGNTWVFTDLNLTPISSGIATGKPTNFAWSVRKDAYYGGDSSGPSLVMEVTRQGGGVYVPFIINPSGNLLLQSASNATNGNVGIGTVAPAYKLQVGSNIWSNLGANYKLAVDGDLALGSAVPGSNSGLSMFEGTNGYRFNLFKRAGYTEFYDAEGKLYFNANVGVGTTTPLYKLDVQGGVTSSASGYISRNNPWSTSDSAFFPNGITTAGTVNWIYGTTTYINNAPSNGSGHQFQGANAYLAIGGGSLGVGTITPSYRLDVQGGQINSSGGLCIAGDCKTAWSQLGGSQWTTAGSNIHYNSGNVGIGTTSPGARLDIGAGLAARGAHSDLLIGAGGNNAQMELYGPTKSSALAHDETLGGLVLYTNGPAWAPSMFVANGGNVGIGTTSPSTKLELASNSAIKLGNAYFSSGGDYLHLANNEWYNGTSWSASAPGALIQISGQDVNFYRHDAVGSHTQSMSINSSGNIGIGTTTPTYKLDVQGGQINSSGGLCIAGDCKTAWSQVGGGGSSQWTTLGSNIYYNSGNVGVGTTNPGGRLHVSSGSNAEIRITDTTTGNPYLSFYDGATPKGYVQYGAGTMDLYAPTGVAARIVTNSTERLRIDVGGNVGIGTASPASGYKLDVNGNTNVTGNLNVTGNINAKYQDLAEWVPSSEQLSAGTVVVLDTTKSNQVVSSGTAYDTRVAGVISAQPGITLGEGGEGKVLVATTGRVRVKVDASRGPIQIGDLLVTSDVSGVAMKSEPVEFAGRKMHMPGTIIGKALEPLAKGSGEILVLLSLQ